MNIPQRPTGLDFWEAVLDISDVLRGMLMIPLPFILYIGGFVALFLWNEPAGTFLLWGVILGPLSIALLSWGLGIILLIPASIMVAPFWLRAQMR